MRAKIETRAGLFVDTETFDLPGYAANVLEDDGVCASILDSDA